jgi:hypothetical protein
MGATAGRFFGVLVMNFYSLAMTAILNASGQAKLP